MSEKEAKKKARGIFIARLAAFLVFGAIAPCCFVMWRYGIFTNGKAEFTTAGWGLIAAFIVFFVVRYVMKEVSDVMPSSMFTQVANGIMKVILPLLILYFVLVNIRDSLDLLIQSVMATILCEAVAIVANPFPKWRYEHQIDERGKSFTDFAKTFVKIWKEGK